MKSIKLTLTISLLAMILTLLFVGIFYQVEETFIVNGISVKMWVILLVMFILELLSTLTFQLRMILTAKLERTKNIKLTYWIAIIATISWLIAGLQGIMLIGGSNELIPRIIKFIPVSIATFNGVLISLQIRAKKGI